MTKAVQTAFWKEHDRELRRLRAKGVTFAEIARLFGVSRGTVLGRANRIGLMGDRAARQTKLVGADEHGRAAIAKLRERIAALEEKETQLRQTLAELEARGAADTSEPPVRVG